VVVPSLVVPSADVEFAPGGSADEEHASPVMERPAARNDQFIAFEIARFAMSLNARHRNH
jgi:hypothetical protein